VQTGIADSGELEDGYFNIVQPAPSPAPPGPPLVPSSVIVGPGLSTSGSGQYGTDVICLPDLDLQFGLVSGPMLLAQAAYHRLSTIRGLIPQHPDDGLDLRQYMNGEYDLTNDSTLGGIGGDIEGELLKDERFQSVDTALTFDSESNTLMPAITLYPTANGQPLTLVLGVTQVQINVLSVTQGQV
jgi:hypothetical protein